MSATNAVKQLRLSNHIAEAMKMASEALGKTPGDFHLMGETIRVLILAQQAEAANGLYQVFSSAGEENNLEPEALVRLALLLDRGDLIEGMDPPAGPSWLVTLITESNDPVCSLEPQTMDIKVTNGPADFNFKGSCPHCDHALEAQVKVSLLINRSWLCPACFGRIQFTHENVRHCLEKTFPDVQDETGIQTDVELIEYLRPRLMGAEPMPDIALALGQEYLFLLNEIILNHLSSDETAGGTGS